LARVRLTLHCLDTDESVPRVEGPVRFGVDHRADASEVSGHLQRQPLDEAKQLKAESLSLGPLGSWQGQFQGQSAGNMPFH
jgi:hypothetical protein